MHELLDSSEGSGNRGLTNPAFCRDLRLRQSAPEKLFRDFSVALPAGLPQEVNHPASIPDDRPPRVPSGPHVQSHKPFPVALARPLARQHPFHRPTRLARPLTLTVVAVVTGRTRRTSSCLFAALPIVSKRQTACHRFSLRECATGRLVGVAVTPLSALRGSTLLLNRTHPDMLPGVTTILQPEGSPGTSSARILTEG